MSEPDIMERAVAHHPAVIASEQEVDAFRARPAFLHSTYGRFIPTARAIVGAYEADREAINDTTTNTDLRSVAEDLLRTYIAEELARATLAERERCARIAETDNHFPQEGAWIATAIRGGTPNG